MSRDPERESQFLAGLATLILMALFWAVLITLGWPKPFQQCQQDSTPAVTDRRGK